MNGKFIPWEIETQSVAGEGGITLNCYKYGRIVTLTINDTTTSAISAWGSVATVPEKFTPIHQVFFKNCLGGGQGFSIGNLENRIIQTNSEIPSQTGVWCTVTYIGKDN